MNDINISVHREQIYPQIKELFSKKVNNFSTFTKLQEIAFSNLKLLENNENILVSGDTSSGKTSIPIVSYITKYMKHLYSIKMLYLVPTITLAEQKKNEISNFLSDYNVDVIISSGENRLNDNNIKNKIIDYCIVVMIYEKAFIYNCTINNFLDDYDIIVFDEINTLNNSERRIKIELLLNYSLNNQIKTIVLTTPSYDFCLYNEAFRLINSDERPKHIKTYNLIFKKGLMINESKKYKYDITMDFNLKYEKTIFNIIYEHLELGHKILVFINSQFKTEEYVNKCYIYLKNKCSKYCKLKDYVKYHHRNLESEERQSIEKEFFDRNGYVRVVFSTETLAHGINSVVDVVIIADVNKYDATLNKERIINSEEYKNYIGRACRLGNTNKYGYAYSLLDSKHKELWKDTVNGYSQISSSGIFNIEANELSFYLLNILDAKDREFTKTSLLDKVMNFPTYITIQRTQIEDRIDMALSLLESAKLIVKIEKYRNAFEVCNDLFYITEKGLKLRGSDIDLYTFCELESIVNNCCFNKGIFLFDLIYSLTKIILINKKKLIKKTMLHIKDIKNLKNIVISYTTTSDLSEYLKNEILNNNTFIVDLYYSLHFYFIVKFGIFNIKELSKHNIHCNKTIINSLGRKISHLLNIMTSISKVNDMYECNHILYEISLALYFNCSKKTISKLESENITISIENIILMRKTDAYFYNQFLIAI